MKGKREFAPELIFGSMKDENPLTKRECDVLRMVADGKTAKEISAILFLSAINMNWIMTARNPLAE